MRKIRSSIKCLDDCDSELKYLDDIIKGYLYGDYEKRKKCNIGAITIQWVTKKLMEKGLNQQEILDIILPSIEFDIFDPYRYLKGDLIDVGYEDIAKDIHSPTEGIYYSSSEEWMDDHPGEFSRRYPAEHEHNSYNKKYELQKRCR